MRTRERRAFAAQVHDCNTRRSNDERTMTTRQPTIADEVATLLSAGGEMAQCFDRAWDSVWQQPHVPATVLELCRLRLARLHGLGAAEAESRVAVDAGKRDSVLAGSYARDARVSPAERAAIGFSEVYAIDAQAITDDLATAVVGHFGEPGLVALIEALGFIDGRLRLTRMLPLLSRTDRHV
jgi:alkylhydroperoxidase family enzyme